MLKQLTEAEIIRIIREEWNAKISSALLELSNKLPDVGDMLSSELKVTHKKSGIRYTIDSVGQNDVVLRTPEGTQMLISKDVLEHEYEV